MRAPGTRPIETEEQYLRQRAKRRAEVAAKKVADAKTAEAVGQAEACFKWAIEEWGLFGPPPEGFEAWASGLQHELATEWAAGRIEELRDYVGTGGEANLLLEYVHSALAVAGEEGARWNAIACAWAEKLPNAGARRYLTKFLPSFQKALDRRKQRLPTGTVRDRGAVAEVVEIVAHYYGLERRRGFAGHVLPERENARAESGTSIVHKALTRLHVNLAGGTGCLAEDTVRDYFDKAQETHAVPFRAWLGKHKKNRTLLEAYKLYFTRNIVLGDGE